MYGTSSVDISDSSFNNNSAQADSGANATTAGAAGAPGGEAEGGGVYFTGTWNATLTGDTFSGNTAIGGNGGNGAAGSDASTPNTSGGNGGKGGEGGDAIGGAADFVVTALGGGGSGTLTILNDSTNPSTMIDNSVQGGDGGNGGNGGISTGTANNSDGGAGGTLSTPGVERSMSEETLREPSPSMLATPLSMATKPLAPAAGQAARQVLGAPVPPAKPGTTQSLAPPPVAGLTWAAALRWLTAPWPTIPSPPASMAEAPLKGPQRKAAASTIIVLIP